MNINPFLCTVSLGLPLLFNACTVGMQMQRQVRDSKLVVLDIGHYYGENGRGQGAVTPDARYGEIAECSFWYRYAAYVKQEIEKAGYSCIICNRGETPSDPALAAAGRAAGVHQVRTPKPGAVYRSKQHPRRMAVGMLSTNFALDQKPACVVYLHHNSASDDWQVINKGAFYINEEGEDLGREMAKVMTSDVLDHGMPNNGAKCGLIIRNDGRLGGGDWLNACEESYVPAAITEVAYLSNPEHAAYLAKPDNAIHYARSIGKGIVNYMKQR